MCPALPRDGARAVGRDALTPQGLAHDAPSDPELGGELPHCLGLVRCGGSDGSAAARTVSRQRERCRVRAGGRVIWKILASCGLGLTTIIWPACAACRLWMLTMA